VAESRFVVYVLQGEIEVRDVSAHARSVVQYLCSHVHEKWLTEAMLAAVSLAAVVCCVIACVLRLWLIRCGLLVVTQVWVKDVRSTLVKTGTRRPRV
jgi:hypothetical protein